MTRPTDGDIADAIKQARDESVRRGRSPGDDETCMILAEWLVDADAGRSPGYQRKPPRK